MYIMGNTNRPLYVNALDFDRQPVISRLDATRQFAPQCLVIETLIHVREHRAPRLHAIDPLQGLGEMTVRHMRRATNAIDDPELGAGERGEGRLVEIDDVRRIRKRSDAEAKGLRKAVILYERNDLDARGAERTIDGMGLKRRFVIVRPLSTGIDGTKDIT